MRRKNNWGFKGVSDTVPNQEKTKMRSDVDEKKRSIRNVINWIISRKAITQVPASQIKQNMEVYCLKCPFYQKASGQFICKKSKMLMQAASNCGG